MPPASSRKFLGKGIRYLGRAARMPLLMEDRALAKTDLPLRGCQSLKFLARIRQLNDLPSQQLIQYLAAFAERHLHQRREPQLHARCLTT